MFVSFFCICYYMRTNIHSMFLLFFFFYHFLLLTLNRSRNFYCHYCWLLLSHIYAKLRSSKSKNETDCIHWRKKKMVPPFARKKKSLLLYSMLKGELYHFFCHRFTLSIALPSSLIFTTYFCVFIIMLQINRRVHP